MYESVLLKNQILVTFIAINIWHSVKSFHISILTGKVIMGQTTRYTEQAHAKSLKLNFISLSFCTFPHTVTLVIILDCHVTHPTLTKKRCVTPHNDACERDHPTPFTINDTQKAQINISKQQRLIRRHFEDHAVEPVSRPVPSEGLVTHSPESSKPDLWRSLVAPLFLCSWNFCLRCDGDTMGGGSEEGKVITGPLYGSLSTFSSLRVWNRDRFELEIFKVFYCTQEEIYTYSCCILT